MELRRRWLNAHAGKGLEDIVDYTEVDTSVGKTMPFGGISNGLYVDGEHHRPYEAPCARDVLRSAILAIAKRKRS
ncbi:MAG: hypothetical protein V2A71_07945 [Candidatus Eisenbacteria bacterium]